MGRAGVVLYGVSYGPPSYALWPRSSCRPFRGSKITESWRASGVWAPGLVGAGAPGQRRASLLLSAGTEVMAGEWHCAPLLACVPASRGKLERIIDKVNLHAELRNKTTKDAPYCVIRHASLVPPRSVGVRATRRRRETEQTKTAACGESPGRGAIRDSSLRRIARARRNRGRSSL